MFQLHDSRSLASTADMSLNAILVRVGWSEEERLESGLLSLADIEDGNMAAKIERGYYFVPTVLYIHVSACTPTCVTGGCSKRCFRANTNNEH